MARKLPSSRQRKRQRQNQKTPFRTVITAAEEEPTWTSGSSSATTNTLSDPSSQQSAITNPSSSPSAQTDTAYSAGLYCLPTNSTPPDPTIFSIGVPQDPRCTTTAATSRHPPNCDCWKRRPGILLPPTSISSYDDDNVDEDDRR